MTQKELLYFEDAIKHEENVIKIIELSISNLDDEMLINFMNDEKSVHEEIKNKLMGLLEVKSNE